ncbi:MAG: DUF255 domain-containing protein [Pirellulaceae bacterium]
MPNRLAQSNSPYLLQHKDNPVDWHPWGPEAAGIGPDTAASDLLVGRLRGVPLVPRHGA